MSADNGIYILETLGRHGRIGFEYRVAELMCIENLFWDYFFGEESDDNDVYIRNARGMWGKCKVTTDKDTAMRVAQKMLDNLDVCEYGIQFIRIPRVF